MAEALSNTIVTVVVSAIVSGCIGFVIGVVTTKRKRAKAESDAIKALLAAKILDDHEKYIIQNHHMTIERHQNVVDTCNSFKTLEPRDQTYTHYIDALCAKKPWQETN